MCKVPNGLIFKATINNVTRSFWESNNNHTSGSSSSSSSSSDTSSSSSDSESDSDSDKHTSSSSPHTFSSADEKECASPKATVAEVPVVNSDEPSNVTAISESAKDRHEPEDGSDMMAERCSNNVQSSCDARDAKKQAQNSNDKKRSRSPDRQKRSHSPNSHRRRSRSSDRDKSHSRGNAKRRSRSRSRDRRRRGESSRSPERRKRTSPSHRSRGERKRTSHSPLERRRRSRSADRKKRSHSPSTRSHRSGDRDRRSRSPAHRRPYEKKPNKLTILERLGIEIKAPNDPTAQPVTPQQLLQRSAEEQAKQIKSTTGIEFPKYYNPAAMNPARYAEQMQKRRLLWGNKSATSTAKSETSAPQPSTNKWEGTTFAQDQDGKMTAKFKRLMGIKDTAQGSSGSSGTEGSEILKKQEEMFNSMEMQYEVARVATHTHRGVGLGFGTFQYPR